VADADGPRRARRLASEEAARAFDEALAEGLPYRSPKAAHAEALICWEAHDAGYTSPRHRAAGTEPRMSFVPRAVVAGLRLPGSVSMRPSTR